MTSRFSTLITAMSTTIINGTDVEAVYSGFDNNTNKRMYAEYGIRAISPINVDANGVLDQTHEMIFVVWSDNADDINEALEEIAILWYDGTNLSAFQSAGGLQIRPTAIEYAIANNSPGKSLGTVTFTLQMRSWYR